MQLPPAGRARPTRSRVTPAARQASSTATALTTATASAAAAARSIAGLAGLFPDFTLQALEPRRMMSVDLPDPLGAARADGNDLVIDNTGTVHRVWRDRDTHALKYASRSLDNVWSPVVTIDATPVGGMMSLAVDANRQPAVAFYDRISGDLEYAARVASGAWSKTTIDPNGDVGDFPSLLINTQGKRFISYYDRSNKDLRYAWTPFTTGGGWYTAAIDTVGDVGGYTATAEGPRQALYVAYADNTNGRLKFASLSGQTGAWSFSVIDTVGPAGVSDVSVMGASGTVLVAYRDNANQRLKTAFQITATNWMTLSQNPGDNGLYASVFLNEHNAPYVLHYDRAGGTVDVVTFGYPDQQQKTRVVALGGDYLNAAVNAQGEMFFNRVEPATGLLRTTATNFKHQTKNVADQRIMHWETIGGSSHNIQDRMVGWSIKQTGWPGYVASRVGLLRSHGMKRMFMHNPFGCVPSEPAFQFDQYLHAQQAGLTWLTNNFWQSWKPVTDAGVEVICYIGKLEEDPDFAGLSLKQYMARVQASIDPLVKAGVSIGLDSIVGTLVDSREYMVAEMLRNSGIKVYAENRPPWPLTHWHDYAGIYYDDGFTSSSPAYSPSNFWNAPDEMLTGEIVRWTSDLPPGHNWNDLRWIVPAAVRILRNGHTAATDISALKEMGVTLDQIMRSALSQNVKSATKAVFGVTPIWPPGTGGDDDLYFPIDQAPPVL